MAEKINRPASRIADMADNAGRTLRMVQRLPDTLQELERGAKAVQHMGSKAAENQPKRLTGWRGFWPVGAGSGIGGDCLSLYVKDIYLHFSSVN